MDKKRKEKERLWRTSKYEVLAHSESTYRFIQQRVNEASYDEVARWIDEANRIEPTTGAVTNAYEHMWGYFKKKATTEERRIVFEQLHRFQHGELVEHDLWKTLYELAERYEETYLLQSTLLVPFKR